MRRTARCTIRTIINRSAGEDEEDEREQRQRKVPACLRLRRHAGDERLHSQERYSKENACESVQISLDAARAWKEYSPHAPPPRTAPMKFVRSIIINVGSSSMGVYDFALSAIVRDGEGSSGRLRRAKAALWSDRGA